MAWSELCHLTRITLAIRAQGKIWMEIHAWESSVTLILIFPKNCMSFLLFGHLMRAAHRVANWNSGLYYLKGNKACSSYYILTSFGFRVLVAQIYIWFFWHIKICDERRIHNEAWFKGWWTPRLEPASTMLDFLLPLLWLLPMRLPLHGTNGDCLYKPQWRFKKSHQLCKSGALVQCRYNMQLIHFFPPIPI